MRFCWHFALLFPLTALAQDGGAPSAAPPAEPESIPVASVQTPEAETETVQRLDPVTVTATKTSRSIYEVPESVSLVSADQIQRYGSSDLGQALTLAPGIELSGGPRSSGESVNIRGLSGTRVLMTVDGARQNYDGAHRSRLLADPDLYKAIDILRGPASAIWGSDALGGVIAMTTKDAADFLSQGERFGGRFKIGTASADEAQRRGGSAFARIGAFDLLADFNQQKSADLVQGDGSTLPHSALDASGSLLKLSQFFSEANEFAVSLQHYGDEGQSPSNPSKEVASDNPLLDRRNQQQYLSGRYSYQAPDADALIAGANLTLYRSALDAVEDRVESPRHDELAFSTRGASTQTTLALPFWQSRLTLGAESYEDEAAATRDGAPRPQFPDSRREVRGYFVQNEFKVGEWSLTPGLRRDHYHSQSNTGAAADIQASALSKKLDLSYALTDWLSFNGVYGEAFRAPSLLESYAQGQHFLGNDFRANPGLRPERGRNRELGFVMRFADLATESDELAIKFNAYDNRIRDYIETVVVVETQGPFPPALQCAPPAPAVGCVNRLEDGSADPGVPVLIHIGGYTTSENLTQARLRGAELESNYRLAGFDLGLSYTRVRGINTADGSPLLSVPADQLRGSLGFRRGAIALGARVTRAFAQARVPLLADGSPVIPPTPGYTVTDLYAAWQPLRAQPGVQLNLGVDNLGNTHYRRHLATAAEAGRSLRAGLVYQF